MKNLVSKNGVRVQIGFNAAFLNLVHGPYSLHVDNKNI